MINRLASRLPFQYGWVIVGVCALAISIIFGIRLSFTVFFVALIEEFGWSRGDTSLIFSVTMFVFMLTSTMSGIAMDWFGARNTFAIGAAVMALGLYLSSRIETLQQLTLTYGVVAGLGITILGLSLQSSLIGRWFERRRGMAIGIAFAGTGVGSYFMTPFIENVIATNGWRYGYIVLAWLMLGLIPLFWLFLRQKPEEVGQVSGDTSTKTIKRRDNDWTFREVVRLPSFWLLALAGLCTMGPVRMLSVHQLAMLADKGIATDVGANIVGTAGATTAVTFILAGILSDRIGRTITYALGGLSLIAATLAIANITLDSPLIWLYPILLGIGEGSRSSLVVSAGADMFSGKAIGTINGTVGAAFGAGAAIYPWMAGVLFDQIGSYQLPVAISVVTVVIAILALYLSVMLFQRAST